VLYSALHEARDLEGSHVLARREVGVLIAKVALCCQTGDQIVAELSRIQELAPDAEYALQDRVCAGYFQSVTRLALGLSRDLALAQGDLKVILRLARHPDVKWARHSARKVEASLRVANDIVGLVGGTSVRASESIAKAEERRKALAERQSRSAKGLVGVAVQILPRAERARYREEFHAELRALPRWRQVAYASRQLMLAWSVRRSLRERPLGATSRAR
jgi:hypothetical protein